MYISALFESGYILFAFRFIDTDIFNWYNLVKNTKEIIL